MYATISSRCIMNLLESTVTHFKLDYGTHIPPQLQGNFELSSDQDSHDKFVQSLWFWPLQEGDVGCIAIWFTRYENTESIIHIKSSDTITRYPIPIHFSDNLVITKLPNDFGKDVKSCTLMVPEFWCNPSLYASFPPHTQLPPWTLIPNLTPI